MAEPGSYGDGATTSNGQVLNCYAAQNQSFDAEQDLRTFRGTGRITATRLTTAALRRYG